jgi:hypothetical protein
MKTKAADYVARERERQNKAAVKGEREIAERASNIAKHTSNYDAQRKSRRKP